MLDYSSNSPDDYTRAHRAILTMIARSGAAVIGIDHLPKGEEARQRGASGTMAKSRAIDGASLRVTLRQTFAPGQGGSAGLTIAKDRPGGLRASCPPAEGKGGQMAGIFVMESNLDGSLSWHVTAPKAMDPDAARASADLAELDGLDPRPKSVRDVKARLGWGSGRSTEAFRSWSALQGGSEGESAGEPG
jgi:hypothetical protein